MKGNFQIIIIIVFIASAVLGVLVFSGAIPLGGNNAPGSLGNVVVWGTVRSEIMSALLEKYNVAHPTYVVQYIQKSQDTFDQDLLEALAGGAGPDLIFLPEDLIYHYSNKIFTIPYASYPLSAFKSNFATAGEVFLNSGGVLAFPLAIDPLVMYYNRSMLDSNGVVMPPATWEDLSDFVTANTKKDETNKIIKSAVALGHFSNIDHAKDILSAMFMQGGNPIVSEKNGLYTTDLNNSSLNYNLAAILQYYIDFADPNKNTYSWNKSFSSSGTAFSEENLALYFGFASELPALVNRNPNQNFLAAPFLQIKNSNFKLTSSHVTGVALMSSSKNFTTAFSAAADMATGDFAREFALETGLAPARRDLLATKPNDAYSPIFYNSALFARAWLDPSTKSTNDIFRNMVDAVLSNSSTPERALSDAGSKLGLLLRK